MSEPIVSRRRADSAWTGVFLVGFGICWAADSWWPALVVVFAVATALRQYLRGRQRDMYFTILIFGGIILLETVNLHFNVLGPVLLVTGGIYLLFREFFVYRKRSPYSEQVETVREMEEDRE